MNIPLKEIYSNAKILDCPECNGELVLKESYRFNRLFYGCKNYPSCKATHGAHPDGSPLGIPANHETKQWRIEAHKAIDPLWGRNQGNLSGREQKRRRSIVYKWLANRLGIKDVGRDCHIAKFDISKCKKVLEVTKGIEIENILLWYVENKPSSGIYKPKRKIHNRGTRYGHG